MKIKTNSITIGVFLALISIQPLANAGSVSSCRGADIVARAGCLEAVRYNKSASNDAILNCVDFSPRIIQMACFEALRYTPNISSDDIFDCHSFPRYQQEECLKTLCPHRGIFGGCED